MKITIVGTGYVGLTSGVCFASLGHDVTCVDIDQDKVALLERGECPIFEEGLSDLLAKNHADGRIQFTTDPSMGMHAAQIVFLCVDTPPGEYGKANLANLLLAAKNCAAHIEKPVLFVNKSTAPVGTVAKIAEVIERAAQGKEFSVASNPEFLQEGSAVKNFMRPDRIVVGVSDQRGHDLLHECYHSFVDSGVPFLVTTVESAELIKYAANAFLALKISFINEIADFSETVDADIADIARGMGLDPRIGPLFLQAGIGYGGSCFGKDVKALAAAGEERGFEFKIIKALSTVNDLRYRILLAKLAKHLGDLRGKKIAILGLAFKPKTDDVRDSPSLRIVHELLERGATIAAFDPVANENFKKTFKESGRIRLADSTTDALAGADALVVLTAWDEFKQLDLAKLKSVMSNGLIVDGRNIFSRTTAEQAGFRYEGVGR